VEGCLIHGGSFFDDESMGDVSWAFWLGPARLLLRLCRGLKDIELTESVPFRFAFGIHPGHNNLMGPKLIDGEPSKPEQRFHSALFGWHREVAVTDDIGRPVGSLNVNEKTAFVGFGGRFLEGNRKGDWRKVDWELGNAKLLDQVENRKISSMLVNCAAKGESAELVFKCHKDEVRPNLGKVK
jgi:hypothetical protein